MQNTLLCVNLLNPFDVSDRNLSKILFKFFSLHHRYVCGRSSINCCWPVPTRGTWLTVPLAHKLSHIHQPVLSQDESLLPEFGEQIRRRDQSLIIIIIIINLCRKHKQMDI